MPVSYGFIASSCNCTLGTEANVGVIVQGLEGLGGGLRVDICENGHVSFIL